MGVRAFVIRAIVGLCLVLAPSLVGAEPVPEALQGRWGAQAGACAAPGEGLTLTADGLTFVTGTETLVALVEASEAGEFRARLTIVSVAYGEGAGPGAGDSLVLERMGDELQGIETVLGGVVRDVSGGAPMVRCE